MNPLNALKRLNPFRLISKAKTVRRTKSYRNYAAILINPVYEPITRLMFTWLNGVHTPDSLGKYIALSGPAVNRSAVNQSLIDTAGINRLQIFCGHGIQTALLGPPQPDEPVIWVGNISHSAIYDAQLIRPGPATLFAYCCTAGAELGKKFSSLRGNTFLGFTGEIPIETENEECMNAFRDIFQKMSEEVIEAGRVLPEHEQRLKNLYHQAFLHFFQGEGRRNKRARYMWLALSQHRRLICRYGGNA